MIFGTSYLDNVVEFGGGAAYFSSHARLIVVIDNDWPTKYVTTASISDALFPSELSESSTLMSYLYYRSVDVSMYLAELP